MFDFHTARARFLALAVPLGPERIALDAADGRVLAEDVASPIDAPDADTSAMDGYAVRSDDLGGPPPFALAVHGEARPGGPAVGALGPNAACRIFTGAALPAGADAIVIQEDVTRFDDAHGTPLIRFATAPRRGAHVRARGEDLARGSVALVGGTRLSPSKLGLLASLDRAWVTVRRRPRVTIVGTGDELRLPGTAALQGSVAESGTLAVRAMAERAGADALVCPMARDHRETLSRSLEEALRTSDLLVTIGGMSEGDYDLVRPVLTELGVHIDFWKVAIKPGKPLAVGTAKPGAGHVLGLPGNPAAAVITFGLFGVPFLRALQGDRAPSPPLMRVRLATAIAQKPGRLTFLRATVARDADGVDVATVLAHQSSASIATVAHADVLVLVPAEVSRLEAGSVVDALAIRDLGA